MLILLLIMVTAFGLPLLLSPAAQLTVPGRGESRPRVLATIPSPARRHTPLPAPPPATHSLPPMSPTVLPNPTPPSLTTATACTRELPGVGATMALGSHEWNGIPAAFMEPSAKRAKRTVKVSPDAEFEVRIPPAVKRVVPARV